MMGKPNSARTRIVSSRASGILVFQADLAQLMAQVRKHAAGT